MDSAPGSPGLAAEILAGTAHRLLELGRDELARKLAELALAEHGGNVSAHNVLSVTCERAGAWQQALEHTRRVCELEPELPRWRYNLALATLRLDDYRSGLDRKSTRLNSSHVEISYAVFCLKKKKNKIK